MGLFPVTLAGGGYRHRWLLRLALALVFLVIHLQYLSKITHSETGVRSAFMRWQVQLRDLDNGVNVWISTPTPIPRSWL